jgi:hypothetical protein
LCEDPTRRRHFEIFPKRIFSFKSWNSKIWGCSAGAQCQNSKHTEPQNHNATRDLLQLVYYTLYLSTEQGSLSRVLGYSCVCFLRHAHMHLMSKMQFTHAIAVKESFKVILVTLKGGMSPHQKLTLLWDVLEGELVGKCPQLPMGSTRTLFRSLANRTQSIYGSNIEECARTLKLNWNRALFVSKMNLQDPRKIIRTH